MDLHGLDITSVFSEVEKEQLYIIPTNAEIKFVVFQIISMESPRHDGLGAGFYKSIWEIIVNDLCISIQSFFQNHEFPSGINHTLIALILKKEDAQTPADYRPISFCTSHYKIIAKVLANRMKLFLDKCIAPQQSAFIPGRSITDNAVITHEVIHILNKITGNCGYVALKLVLAKACDKMEWPFLLQIMRPFGFLDIFLNWIRVCSQLCHTQLSLMGSVQDMFALLVVYGKVVLSLHIYFYSSHISYLDIYTNCNINKNSWDSIWQKRGKNYSLMLC